MSFGQAVVLMKRAGLGPTRRRMAVAAVAFAGVAPATAEDLRDRALDAGLYLTPEAAEEAWAELGVAGCLAEM